MLWGWDAIDIFGPVQDVARFERAMAAFDAANAEDPNHETVDDQSVPHELVDARRVSVWIDRLAPDASEALRLAGRCQHIRRWEIPRDRYPKTRAGYLKWRQDLKQFHADAAASILRDCGYDDELICTVQALNLKKGLAQGGDVQVLEDALCLTFLEFEFESFFPRVSKDRMLGILRKTWGKMSDQAHQEALALSFGEAARQLIGEALEAD